MADIFANFKQKLTKFVSFSLKILKGGGTMLFHAFRVVYTVKELDSHAKNGQSFKKRFGRMADYFCAKNLTSGLVQVSESFFNHGSCWRKRGWNSLYGHFSRKNAPVHTSTGARARARPSTRFITARDSLGKNVSKEVCFWLWGKDNLVQLPKTTQRYVNSGYSLFFRGSNGVSQVCLLRSVL